MKKAKTLGGQCVWVHSLDYLPHDNWPFLYRREALIPDLNLRGITAWHAVADSSSKPRRFPPQCHCPPKVEALKSHLLLTEVVY
jgi:hypothetical protein